jgi:cell division protein FtsI/penicillin-binding protein 2
VALEPPPGSAGLAKGELAALLSAGDLKPSPEDGEVEIRDGLGRPLHVKTTLDPDLQAKALGWVRGAGGLHAALVILDPGTGRILALAGTERGGGNAALDGAFPAASVFKIVTAAAVMERADFTAESVVAYDGSKHTLYKNNVNKDLDQGSHEATLRESFAESINSVFGKLGAFGLTPAELEEMANNFGFNENIGFELPLAVSSFALGDGLESAPAPAPADDEHFETPPGDAPDHPPAAGGRDDGLGAGFAFGGTPPVSPDLSNGISRGEISAPLASAENNDNGAAGTVALADFSPAVDAESPDGREAGDTEQVFRIAELASGFNRRTKLNPVLGAMIASVAANGGDLYEPSVVSEVTDAERRLLYKSSPRLMATPVTPRTAGELSILMEAAVTEGTGRKHFSDAGYHPLLSRLQLGGKSGTINDENGARVDWFVAFARPGDPSETAGGLAMAAVVVHDGKYNLASQELIRKALLAYYKPRLSDETKDQGAVARKSPNNS